MTHQSISGMKATPIYTAPEILLYDDDFSMASDIYSFAIIIYEIISSRKPFAEIENMNQLFNEIVKNGKRPFFDEEFPVVYKELIERCWSQDPRERPMCDEILIEMKTNKEFLIEKINKDDFYKYVNFVEEQIEIENVPIKIEETQENSNIINRRRVTHKMNNSDEPVKESLKNNINNESLKEVIQNESNSIENFKSNQNELNMKSQTVEKIKNFDVNSDVKSLELNFIKFCNENDPENIYKFASLLIKTGQTLAPIKYATKLYNLGYYKQSFGLFNLISCTNNPIAYYYIGIMKFYGQGCSIDIEESKQILSKLSKYEIEKATEFLEDHSNQFK